MAPAWPWRSIEPAGQGKPCLSRTTRGSKGSVFDRRFDLYSQRPDKGWSLTDCISFVVMIDRGLTGDHHFEQAGFLALLRDP